MRAALVLASAATLGACNSGTAPGPSGVASARVPPAATGAAARPASAPAKPSWLRGPSGGAAIAPFVAHEVRSARAEKQDVLVYVGAPWCEPCQRFHQAVERGELDALLRGTRIVEFDLDVDRDALQAAGYASRMIPLFAVPRDDGTASERRMEGSVKGEAAVHADLVPRLRAMLVRAGG